MAIKVVHEWFRHTKSAKDANGKSIDEPDPKYTGAVRDLASKAWESHFSGIKELELWHTGRRRTEALVKIYGDRIDQLDSFGVVSVHRPCANLRLQDVKEATLDCNIFYGDGVENVDYATAIQEISKIFRVHGFTYEGVEALKQQEIYTSFDGVWQTAQECIEHFRDRTRAAITKDRDERSRASYPLGTATCLHGPTSDSVLLALGTDVTDYLIAFGGTREGTQSGLLELSVEDARIVEAKLSLERAGNRANFVVDPWFFNAAPRQY